MAWLSFWKKKLSYTHTKEKNKASLILSHTHIQIKPDLSFLNLDLIFLKLHKRQLQIMFNFSKILKRKLRKLQFEFDFPQKTLKEVSN